MESVESAGFSAKGSRSLAEVSGSGLAAVGPTPTERTREFDLDLASTRGGAAMLKPGKVGGSPSGVVLRKAGAIAGVEEEPLFPLSG